MAKRIVRIVGPVQHDPNEEGLLGMGWFVPYLDSSRLADRPHWHVFPRWSKNRRPTRDHAIEARERLLRMEGAHRIDDMETFLAVCDIVKAAKRMSARRGA